MTINMVSNTFYSPGFQYLNKSVQQKLFHQFHTHVRNSKQTQLATVAENYCARTTF